MIKAKGLTYSYISINPDGPTMVVECEIPGSARDPMPKRATLEFDIKLLDSIVKSVKSDGV